MKRYEQSKFFNMFVKLTGLPVALVYYKTKTFYESDKSPRKIGGNTMLVMNHCKLLDMPLIWMKFFGTNIRFLIAEVMFNKTEFMNMLLYKIGSIKVDRNAFDFGFMCEAIDILDAGGTIGIFPSGRLPVDGKPFPFKPSVAFIALHSDATIVPIYVNGKYGLGKRARIVIGDPINPREIAPGDSNSPETMNYLTEYLEKKIYSLSSVIEKEEGSKNA